MKLDTSKPYGTVYGDADHAFEQDGKRFDHAGEEIMDGGTPKKRGPKPKDDQLKAQLEELS
ncbi:hypothetical protein [Acidithiobacillus sp.]|uniref:hypothetical protein n=1 Tax=Acidithiobacillus sp. TaxID=1872118 RepID=UPI00258D80F7|nr:hypothetical protein [Acidithiobacillus sp.]MDD5375282.1 hypothetical protein [Acidithiobacillus sp.]